MTIREKTKPETTTSDAISLPRSNMTSFPFFVFDGNIMFLFCSLVNTPIASGRSPSGTGDP
ncbi:hypothetical protein [Fulvimarina endophytica]|uniref:hypothetical protein n=1 Tax=Fulvimarina endophytica TaxID=2293836 RepID=UPI0011C042EB|nr:hypothetical protein [Fulvimarina endophytica]